MTKAVIKIIGIGSPNGEDRLGWQAVEQLQATEFGREFADHDVEFVANALPGPPLFSALENSDLAILIDAMHSKADAGTVREVQPREIANTLIPLSTHGLDLPQCLKLAETMGRPPRALCIIGIEVGAGIDLSAVGQLCRQAIARTQFLPARLDS